MNNNEKRDRQCIYYHGIDECKCNNDPDDYGDCIYEDGIETKNVDLKCKHYKPFKDIPEGQDTPSITITIPENWQDILEKLSFQNKRNIRRKQAYICSPCRADTAESISVNMKAARLYMYFAHTELDMNASAPHAYLPIILCDKIPAERALAMKFCLSLIETGVTVLVCGNRLTSGMMDEISHAARIGEEIQVFNELLYTDVQKIVIKAGADKKLVVLQQHHMMALSPKEIISMPEVH